MTKITRVIQDDDVVWTMDWGKSPNAFGDEGKEPVFEHELALAMLLMNEVVFINSHWWKFAQLGERDATTQKFSFSPKPNATWTKDESRLISVNVDCGDVFAWGCSDSEALPYDEVETLYRMWRKDPAWGASVWCMIQRRQMPQKPVEDIIAKAGIWDLHQLGLGQNTMDEACSTYLASVLSRNNGA